MRPWKKRGFLHWLLFQDPAKRHPSQPRRKALPQQPPKELEVDLAENITETSDSHPETVIAYPVPCDEGVLEAKIIDFVENGGDDADAFTGHVKDEYPDEPMQEQNALESAVPPDITLDNLIIPIENHPDVTETASAQLSTAAETDLKQNDYVSSQLAIADLTMFLDALSSGKNLNAEEKLDEPQSGYVPEAEPQDDEPQVELPSLQQSKTDEIAGQAQYERVEQNLMAEPSTESGNEDLIITETPSTQDEAQDETLPETDTASEIESYQEPTSAEWPQVFTWEANNEAEREPKIESEPLPDYIREANEELPLSMQSIEAPSAPLADDIEQTPPVKPVDTHTCNLCGTVSEKSDNFCGKCGTKLTEPPTVKAYCANCGVKNEHLLKFCGDCGHKLVRS